MAWQSPFKEWKNVGWQVSSYVSKKFPVDSLFINLLPLNSVSSDSQSFISDTNFEWTVKKW